MVGILGASVYVGIPGSATQSVVWSVNRSYPDTKVRQVPRTTTRVASFSKECTLSDQEINAKSKNVLKSSRVVGHGDSYGRGTIAFQGWKHVDSSEEVTKGSNSCRGGITDILQYVHDFFRISEILYQILKVLGQRFKKEITNFSFCHYHVIFRKCS
ncbi:unnamed protein product, partial [Nesidiocoris tenuis]